MLAGDAIYFDFKGMTFRKNLTFILISKFLQRNSFFFCVTQMKLLIIWSVDEDLHISGNFSTAVLPCCNPPHCHCDLLTEERMYRGKTTHPSFHWQNNVLSDILLHDATLHRNEREISDLLNGEHFFKEILAKFLKGNVRHFAVAT